LKYISRIDSNYTHCYYVRAGYGHDDIKNKTFTDGVYGGKRKALIAAKRWRDKEIKRTAAKTKAYKALQRRHFGKGYSLSKDERFDPVKLSWRATYWSKAHNRQLTKTFSVNRYGYRLAKKLATQWRKIKLTGEP